MDADALINHWLVQAIADLADGRWVVEVAEAEAVIFALADPASPDWPATVSIVTVAGEDWPTEEILAAVGVGSGGNDSDLGADTLPEGTVRIARQASPDRALAYTDVIVDGVLPGTPLSAELWINTWPQLRVVATASGADLYELGRLLDVLADTLDAVPVGADSAPSTS